ncbi:MAG: DUF3426 domain-containing protein [Gallionella sp.]|nr:DUF3426 domain-containing protein [Gallionella sp.]
MSGTTLCPHCNTRFKVDEAQLESHHGMVRCGHCLKSFNARTNFVPEQPNPQLELPILEDEITPAETAPVSEQTSVIEEPGAVEKTATLEKTGEPEGSPSGSNEAANLQPPEIVQPEIAQSEIALPETAPEEAPGIAHTDFAPAEQDSEVSPAEQQSSDIATLQPMTLAEQVAVVEESDDAEPLPKNRRWPWVTASALLVLVLFAQAAYFFRVDLAAHLPGLKPALTVYCKLLRCSVPLPQKTDLMSIESSDLEADPAHENRVVLNALLRNRAAYAQAFPDLELTLNDTNDKPLARRTFKPKDYLPPQENEPNGLLPNHELSVKLQLGTADLKPTGYRLALHYPRQ